jgi:hypothetical protein
VFQTLDRTQDDWNFHHSWQWNKLAGTACLLFWLANIPSRFFGNSCSLTVVLSRRNRYQGPKNLESSIHTRDVWITSPVFYYAAMSRGNAINPSSIHTHTHTTGRKERSNVLQNVNISVELLLRILLKSWMSGPWSSFFFGARYRL